MNQSYIWNRWFFLFKVGFSFHLHLHLLIHQNIRACVCLYRYTFHLKIERKRSSVMICILRIQFNSWSHSNMYFGLRYFRMVKREGKEETYTDTLTLTPNRGCKVYDITLLSGDGWINQFLFCLHFPPGSLSLIHSQVNLTTNR